VDLNSDLFAVRTEKTSIQWPTEQQILVVSARLARMVKAGIRFEANGDYFKSGDLAYQIQEIIRTTAELLKRCERGKGSGRGWQSGRKPPATVA
jgi:hypothetical protein